MTECRPTDTSNHRSSGRVWMRRGLVDDSVSTRLAARSLSSNQNRSPICVKANGQLGIRGRSTEVQVSLMFFIFCVEWLTKLGMAIPEPDDISSR